MARKPVVALVGRPNVGKSTLFNRLVGMRMSVTDDIPGTTRDRVQAESDWNGVNFHVVDTGGIEVYEPKGVRDTSPLAEGSKEFVEEIRAQAMIAIQDADIVVMLVDINHGITGADQEIARILRQSERPVLVAANKGDNLDQKHDSYEFYGLGVGEVYPISAIHGVGVGDLLDAMVEAMDIDNPEYEVPEDDSIKIAIVGRPKRGQEQHAESPHRARARHRQPARRNHPRRHRHASALSRPGNHAD